MAQEQVGMGRCQSGQKPVVEVGDTPGPTLAMSHRERELLTLPTGGAGAGTGGGMCEQQTPLVRESASSVPLLFLLPSASTGSHDQDQSPHRCAQSGVNAA